MVIHVLRVIWKMLRGGFVASACFFPTVPTKVWIFLTVRPCGVSRGGEFSNGDVAAGGPRPFSGAGFLGDMVSLC